MTPSNPTTTYRYVADDSMLPSLSREAWVRARDPRLSLCLVILGLVLGVSASLITNAASLPHYLVEVLLIGVALGLIWILGVALIIVIVVVPLATVVNRRMAKRLFPPESVTEVELGPEGLTIRRRSGSRSMPYRTIRRVRTSPAYVVIEARSRPFGELLPRGLLPDSAVEEIRARSRGVWPAGTTRDEGDLTRQMVVPPRWAAHVAALHIRGLLVSARFWVRGSFSLVLAVPSAVISGPAWLLLTPAFALFLVTWSYVQTRRAVGAALPPGSLATSHVEEDRLITHSHGGSREIPYDNVRSVDVRGDVVFVRLVDWPVPLAIARTLIPDEALGNLRV